MHAIGDATLVEVLKEQLRQTHEREQQGREREARLLSLLEAEQQARRDLEQKLLPPPPRPSPAGHTWLILLVILLVVALAALAWHFRAGMIAALAP